MKSGLTTLTKHKTPTNYIMLFLLQNDTKLLLQDVVTKPQFLSYLTGTVRVGNVVVIIVLWDPVNFHMWSKIRLNNTSRVKLTP